MRRLFLGVLLLALAGGGLAQAEETHLEINRPEPTIKLPAEGINIKGKWGLGVHMGGLINSSGEAYLIRGKTERTAWIFDINVEQQYRDSRDSSGRMSELYQTFAASIGPRLRRYTRPQSKLSPYLDVYSHVGGGRDRHYGGTDIGASFGAGLAGGAEYFTPWHFSLAAHTGLFDLRVLRSWHGEYGHVTSRSFSVSSGISITPFLHVRVYF